LKTSPPQEFARVFSQRLQGLAASHDLLVEENWHGADMLQLVRQQFAPFRESLEQRVTLTGPDLWLNAAAVQTIGMAIHELATNAVKHGALSNESGSVVVIWTLAGEGPAERFSLCWKERDGPAVGKPSRHGLGHGLLTVMTPHTLSGKARLDYAADGVTWTVECPAEAVLEKRTLQFS
jgi:two-component sensor histidine kinase